MITKTLLPLRLSLAADSWELLPPPQLNQDIGCVEVFSLKNLVKITLSFRVCFNQEQSHNINHQRVHVTEVTALLQ